jgi:hypothetical protein
MSHSAKSMIKILIWIALVVFAFALLTAIDAQAAVPTGIADNLYSCWEFDEESGTRNDAVGTLHLTDNNTVGFIGSAIQSKGASFVGANSEYLNVSSGNPDVSNSSYSVSVWFWLNNLSSIQHIYYGGTNRLRLSYDSALGYLKYRPGATTYNIDNVTWTAQTWYHIVTAYDLASGTLKIYVNNSLAKTIESANKPQTGTVFQIGGIGGQYMTGYIDIPAIWTRALSADEISWLYNSGSGRSCATIVSSSIPTPTATATSTSTPTPTVTPTATPTPTSTVQLALTEVFTLQHGEFGLERTATYGDIAVVVTLIVVIALFVIWMYWRSTQQWMS